MRFDRADPSEEIPISEASWAHEKIVELTSSRNSGVPISVRRAAESSMNMSREEFDAKQEAAAGRIELSVAAFKAEVQSSLRANDKAMDQFRIDAALSHKDMADFRTDMTRQLAGFQGELGGLRAELGGFRAELVGFKADIAPVRTMKANFWGAVAVMVGTVIAAMTLGLGAFDSGRDTAQATAQSAAEVKLALEQARQAAVDQKRLLESAVTALERLRSDDAKAR